MVQFSTYSVLVPIILGIIQIKNLNRYLLALLALVIFSGLSDWVVMVDFGYRDIAWPTYRILQFLLVSTIFLSVTSSPFNRRLVYSFLGVFIIYFPFHFFFFKDPATLFPNLKIIAVFLYMILSISFFLEIYNEVKFDNLFLYPFFWINVGILIYFSGNLFLTLSYNIFSMEKVYKLYLVIHSLLNGVKNLLFGVAFIVHFLEIRKKALI